MWRDVPCTSRKVQSGNRRPCPCRSKSEAGGTAMRAGGRLCTWTPPSPLSAPLPPTAPSSGAYPLTPHFLPCGAVAPQANRGTRCHGLGGQGARQPSLRSGRLRRPARAEQDNSRRHTPCPQCLLLVRRAGASLLAANAQIPPMAASRCFGGQVNCPRRRRTPPRPNKSPCVAGKVGAADCLPPFLRPSSRQSHAPDGCSSLRTISAGV